MEPLGSPKMGLDTIKTSWTRACANGGAWKEHRAPSLVLCISSAWGSGAAPFILNQEMEVGCFPEVCASSWITEPKEGSWEPPI